MRIAAIDSKTSSQLKPSLRRAVATNLLSTCTPVTLPSPRSFLEV
jgi:hypothetical protein